MKLSQPNARLYVPDGGFVDAALSRTTHMGIGAHADDLEFMAYSAIADCWGTPQRWFSGITVTNGANSPVSGPYADFTPDEITAIRGQEQEKAALIGQYSFQAQLGYSSASVKAHEASVVEDLKVLLESARPEVLYLHQPFDKHPTHIAVLKCTLLALKQLTPEMRPKVVYGCEVWRSLDWVPDSYKVSLPTAAHPELVTQLHQCFRTQIYGGKRYDLAVPGRWLANATFHQSHAVDAATKLSWALDLTSLTKDDGPSLEDYMQGILDAFTCETLRNADGA